MNGTMIATSTLGSIVSVRTKHKNIVARHHGEFREPVLAASEIELATAALIALIILLGVLFLSDMFSSLHS